MTAFFFFFKWIGLLATLSSFRLRGHWNFVSYVLPDQIDSLRDISVKHKTIFGVEVLQNVAETSQKLCKYWFKHAISTYNKKMPINLGNTFEGVGGFLMILPFAKSIDVHVIENNKWSCLLSFNNLSFLYPFIFIKLYILSLSIA